MEQPISRLTFYDDQDGAIKWIQEVIDGKMTVRTEQTIDTIIDEYTETVNSRERVEVKIVKTEIRHKMLFDVENTTE